MPRKTYTRPSQARAIETRQRLVDSALAGLTQHGLSRTSTIAVARRAGVAQGTVFRHFANKQELLAETVERALALFVRQFRDTIDARLRGPAFEPVHTAVTVLWEIFRIPEMRAVFEVYIAAKTDRALARKLAPILERHRRAIVAEAHALFPVTPGARAELEEIVDVIVNAMQGAALGVLAERREEAAQLALIERVARRELDRLPLARARRA